MVWSLIWNYRWHWIRGMSIIPWITNCGLAAIASRHGCAIASSSVVQVGILWLQPPPPIPVPFQVIKKVGDRRAGRYQGDFQVANRSQAGGQFSVLRWRGCVYLGAGCGLLWFRILILLTVTTQRKQTAAAILEREWPVQTNGRFQAICFKSA